MSENKISQIIREEYIKCATDPIHFLKKYCYIQNPDRGRILFHLYPFQEKVLNLLMNNEYSLINKSRQLGISTLVAGLALHMMIFQKDKNILCIATKQDTAKNLITKVKFMYTNLPTWLKLKSTEENNKLTLRLSNGSQIKATSAASDAGRSEAVSLLIIDEAAFISNIEEIWGSAQQTLATGGNAIVLSTPYGTGNWFHKNWVLAEQADVTKSKFIPIKLPWYVHPERDQEWRDKQDTILGDPRLAAQECFSGDTIIYTLDGPKFIKDIKINDRVLSHDGTYNTVVKTMSSISTNVYEIKGGLNNIQKFVTSNHPFLNVDGNWEDIKSIAKTSNKVEVFPTKIDEYKREIKSIDLLQYINANNPKFFPLKNNEDNIWLTKTNIINRFIDFDYDLGFLVGCFLAEGSLANNKVEFSFNGKTEREGFPLQIERILNNKFNINKFSYYTSKRWEGSSKLYIKDQIFNSFIKLCIKGGNLCHQKSISDFFYNNSNEDTLRGVLDGILVGDGMLKEEYNISLGLTSEKLIYDVLYISNILGIYNVTIKRGKSTNPHNPDKWRYNYTLTWLNTKIENNSKIFSERTKDIDFNKNSTRVGFEYFNKCYAPLKLKKSKKSTVVYNLEVENTHTYVTEYGIAHNCDCNFSTSGDVVFYGEVIEWYQKTYQKDPIERRGLDKNLWIWENVDYSRSYMVIADVARGDGKDFSTFHIMDIETNTQVAEFKGQLGTREFGHLLVGIATEYNEALLIVENTGIGWDVVQTCIERGYVNLYYSPKNDKTTSEDYFDKYEDISKMTPGFSMTLKTRPMVINKFREYFNEKSVIIQSVRTYEEMKVFMWKNGRAEAQQGYNDDLIMPMGIGLYVRDTAFKFRQQGLDLTREALKNFRSVKPIIPGAFNGNNTIQNPYKRTINGHEEDFSWVI